MKEQKIRITSIDALRAIVLLGILLVHTKDLFGFLNPENAFPYFTVLDRMLSETISVLLSGRCNIIFSILFGVSFYLILKNPQYSSAKFVWRCFLLMLLGLLVKSFYTYDALMWYGIMGMLLVLFRNIKPNCLFLIFCATISVSLYSVKISLGDILFDMFNIKVVRYDSSTSLLEIIRYPLISSIVDYLQAVFNGGVLKTLSCFILGYFIAKIGVIDNLPKYSNLCNLLVLGFLYVLLFVLSHFVNNNQFVLRLFSNLFGALFYAVLFLYIYYKCSKYMSFSWLEAYGKLGLTNYVMQNIVGVVLMSTIFIPYRVTFVPILISSIVFYIIQMLFSVVWLRYYKFGPLEWCWRCLTNKCFMSNCKYNKQR